MHGLVRKDAWERSKKETNDVGNFGSWVVWWEPVPNNWKVREIEGIVKDVTDKERWRRSRIKKGEGFREGGKN